MEPMRARRSLALAATFVLPLSALTAQAAAAGSASAPLFDRVAEVLGDKLFDHEFCERRLPALVERFRPAALAATSAAEERAVVHALLAEVPASHLALLSAATHRRLEAELVGRRTAMVGCSILRLGARCFVDGVYDGGPAQRAGLRTGDEVLAIDGEAPGASPRLDWRSDDAHLSDPPTHDLLVADGDAVRFTLGPADARHDVEVTAAPWSGLQASTTSVREIVAAGRRLLYVHLWFVFHARAGRLLQDALSDHDDCEGLLLDLRGRGGSALECAAIVRAVADAAERGVPTVALVDARTRSAKEVVASDLKRRGIALLVGERTAGAVLPASFVQVADDAVLMLPENRLGQQSARIEGHGVEPDYAVAAPLPPVPGKDPILQAGTDALVKILGAPTGR